MKNLRHTVRRYYVLPCCLLLLNLCVEIVSYKARLIVDPVLRTLVIMAMVLGGASLVAYAIAPGIEWLVTALQRGSRTGGRLGEWVFLGLLGVAIFWLYHQIYIVGPEAVLPSAWENPA